MTHLKQDVFQSERSGTTDVCIYPGTDLQEKRPPAITLQNLHGTILIATVPAGQWRKLSVQQRSQMKNKEKRLQMACQNELAAVLKDELAALRIWRSAKNSRGALALPDDIWDGMTISIDKIETVLRKYG